MYQLFSGYTVSPHQKKWTKYRLVISMCWDGGNQKVCDPTYVASNDYFTDCCVRSNLGSYNCDESSIPNDFDATYVFQNGATVSIKMMKENIGGRVQYRLNPSCSVITMKVFNDIKNRYKKLTPQNKNLNRLRTMAAKTSRVRGFGFLNQNEISQILKNEIESHVCSDDCKPITLSPDNHDPGSVLEIPTGSPPPLHFSHHSSHHQSHHQLIQHHSSHLSHPVRTLRVEPVQPVVYSPSITNLSSKRSADRFESDQLGSDQIESDVSVTNSRVMKKFKQEN